MRPLIRSMFLLSLAVSPLALAEAPAANVKDQVATATASGSTSADIDEATLRTDVQELELAVANVRSELAKVRTQDERTDVVGAVNDHPLWP